MEYVSYLAVRRRIGEADSRRRRAQCAESSQTGGTLRRRPERMPPSAVNAAKRRHQIGAEWENLVNYRNVL